MGMLAGVTELLCGIAGTVSVVARRPEREARVNPLAVEYLDSEQLAVVLRRAMAQFGPVESHPPAPGLPCWHAKCGRGHIDRVDERTALVEVVFKGQGWKVLSLEHCRTGQLLHQPLDQV